MNFDIPRDVILPVEQVDVRLELGEHPFETDNIAAIEDNWARETTANPSLFDGKVVLLSSLIYRARRLEGSCHAIRYATFMQWRRQRDLAPAAHAYAHAMLVSSDNALIAARMGSHTANPGLVYFAAGSFEPIDFPNGQVDLDFNMAREVGEETGIKLEGLRRDPAYHAYSMSTGTVIFRRYYVPDTAERIARGIESFLAADSEPELDSPVIIRGVDDLPAGLASHMVPLIDWHFSTAR